MRFGCPKSGSSLAVIKLLLLPKIFKRLIFFLYLKAKVNLPQAPGAAASANLSPGSSLTPGAAAQGLAAFWGPNRG